MHTEKRTKLVCTYGGAYGKPYTARKSGIVRRIRVTRPCARDVPYCTSYEILVSAEVYICIALFSNNGFLHLRSKLFSVDHSLTISVKRPNVDILFYYSISIAMSRSSPDSLSFDLSFYNVSKKTVIAVSDAQTSFLCGTLLFLVSLFFPALLSIHLPWFFLLTQTIKLG